MFLRWTPCNNRRSGFTLAEVMMSLLIFGLVVGSLIYGYVQVNRMAMFNSMSLAAQSYASQGLEEARSAQYCYVRWPNTNANAQDPYWTPASVGFTNLPAQTNTLDVIWTGGAVYVTNYVSVVDVQTNANMPLRQIRSDCVWAFPLDGVVYTNTAITLRAPDE
jgi:prepilin-type N-terminal cleavage/methylation domain-containing protein